MQCACSLSVVARAQGGQSATGKLVDHVINTHAAVNELKEKATRDGVTIYAWLDRHLQSLATARGVTDVTYLTADVSEQLIDQTKPMRFIGLYVGVGCTENTGTYVT